jgi:hypothetical protein
MALSVVPMYKWAWGASEFMSIITVTGDTTYVSGTGYALPPSLFTFNTFAATSDFQLQTSPINTVGLWADCSHSAPGAGGYGQIDVTTGNLRLYQAAGTEVASGTAVTYVTALIAFGH